MKTGLHFEKIFFRAIKDQLPISGGYYRDGVRPLDNVSTSEDCVVIFKTGIDGDIQRGFITINVFIPDISFDGRQIKNIARCELIEEALQDFYKSLRIPSFMLEKEGTIRTYKVYETNEHFVHLEIRYNYLNI